MEHPEIQVKTVPVAHCHHEDTNLINKEKFKSGALKFIKEDTGWPGRAAYIAAVWNVEQGGGD